MKEDVGNKGTEWLAVEDDGLWTEGDEEAL